MKRSAPDAGPMPNPNAPAFDIDAELQALEREVQGASKKAAVQSQVISAKPVSSKREITQMKEIVPPPPPSVSAGVAAPPPPPVDFSYPGQGGDDNRGYVPPRMLPSVPVPKQYNAMKQHNARPAVYKMAAAGQSWSDDSLHDWPDDDHRIFVGDLGNECNDDLLAQAFSQYASFQKAKVIRDKRTGKTKGYGFVSFTDVDDFMRAIREMNGKYVGNRPIKLRKSTWDKRMSNSSENTNKDSWMKSTAFKSKKHVKAVDAPRHRHGR